MHSLPRKFVIFLGVWDDTESVNISRQSVGGETSDNNARPGQVDMISQEKFLFWVFRIWQWIMIQDNSWIVMTTMNAMIVKSDRRDMSPTWRHTLTFMVFMNLRRTRWYFFMKICLGAKKKKKSEPKTYSSLKWLSRFHSKLTSFRNFSDSTQPLGLESPNQSTLIPRRCTGVYRKYE